LSSATVGLHLALHVLGRMDDWQDGDEVITTPLTFVSTNHAIVYERLRPVFADVDQHLCLDPESIESRITDRTRAVVFVGLGGNAGQLGAVADLCRRRGLRLILDAAHMAGSRIHGRHVGGESDVTIFSFQAVKNLPTADSGMVCFQDRDHDALARELTWLGINKDTFARTVVQGSYKWHYDVASVGFKYHGNSIMAALGLVGLRYLDQDNAYRRQLCAWYSDALNHRDDIEMVPVAAGCESSRHLFQILVDYRDEVMMALAEHGIHPGVHYRDNTEYSMYRHGLGTCPRATEASRRVISLPLHLELGKREIERISAAVCQILDAKVSMPASGLPQVGRMSFPAEDERQKRPAAIPVGGRPEEVIASSRGPRRAAIAVISPTMFEKGSKREVPPRSFPGGRLRLIERGDLEMTRAWRNRPDIRCWFRMSDEISAEHHAAWFERYRDRDDEYLFIVEHNAVPVGQVGLCRIDREAGTAEYGRLLLGERGSLGKGIAQRASATLFEIAREVFGLRSLTLEVRGNNERAIALYRKLAFVNDGFRDGFLVMTCELGPQPALPRVA